MDTLLFSNSIKTVEQKFKQRINEYLLLGSQQTGYEIRIGDELCTTGGCAQRKNQRYPLFTKKKEQSKINFIQSYL